MLFPVISGYQIIREASSGNLGEEVEKPTANIRMQIINWSIFF